MRVGRKLGYAAAIAGGLLLATAWAAAAQNPCNGSFGSLGLTFTNCVDPDPALAIPAETACNNLYTQGYWSNPALAGGAGEHEVEEANLIRAGLRAGSWSTGVVGGINWEFDADTETVETLWGYEDPATIAQTIADYTTIIDDAVAALAVAGGANPILRDIRDYAVATRDILQDLQAGGHQVPYYVDLPYWVDHARATPPSFDPNVPTYQATLDPLPEYLTPDVGYFTTTPPWDPTLIPALEILKCEGWSATDFTGDPVKYDNRGIYCRTRSGWSYERRLSSSGRCEYSRPRRTWVPPDPGPPPRAGYHYDWTETDYEDWDCRRRSQSITIGSTPPISENLPGTRAINTSTGFYSCRYRFPRSVLNNFSSQLDQFDVNLGASSKPAVSVTIGHDILDNTSHMASTPIGWAVRWTEHARPHWPLGCDGFKPCWDTFDPAVRMAPRLDQLTVGTPVWVWMNDVLASCLPNATPAAPAPGGVQDCDPAQPSVWEAWPRDEADPNMWRRASHRRPGSSGAFWRAVFPQRVSIELVHATTGVSSTYECWTDDHGRSVGDGEWAPGQRPTEGTATDPRAVGYPTRAAESGGGGLHVRA